MSCHLDFLPIDALFLLVHVISLLIYSFTYVYFASIRSDACMYVYLIVNILLFSGTLGIILKPTAKS